ncbi:MAG: hypothetical protein WA708_06820 [Acidobacteriaceae bacterium]
MSFDQKSDVKKHFSSRRHKALLPFRSTTQSIAADISRNEHRDENRDMPTVGQKSGLEFSAATPNAPHEIPARPIDSLDEPSLKKPLA